jgi:hypothetical protein
MIGPYLNSMASPVQVMAPVPEALDDSHKLFVWGSVVYFSPLELLGEEGNWVPFLSIWL